MNLQQKEIQFNEDVLLGAKVENGSVYLAVKNTAINIGLTEKQADNEIAKIKTLELFKNQWCELTLKFEVQGRKTICINEKFVPMWLAQINLTPQMRLQNPEACTKLLKYQLECADILHTAFMGDEDSKKNFYDRFDIKMENMFIEYGNHMLEAIKSDVIEPLNTKIISLESHIQDNNKVIDIANEHNFILQNKFDKLEETVNNINNKFKISYNKSALFEKLKIDFLSTIKYADTTSYTLFYKHIQNWLGYNFPYSTNTKQWILKNIDISIIEEFVNGVIIGRIVQSKKGNWVDLSGIYENQVEWAKILSDFDHSCAYCGIKSDKLVGEHIICQSNKNSSNAIFNLIPSCPSCNYSKYNHNVTEWYKDRDFYTEERWEAICDHYANYEVDMTE